MDVNGDGRADLAVNARGVGGRLQLTLFLSEGTGFGPPTVLPVTDIPYGPGSRLIPLDIDGDGSIDLVCVGQNGAYAGLTVLRSEPDGAAELDHWCPAHSTEPGPPTCPGVAPGWRWISTATASSGTCSTPMPSAPR